MKKTFFILILAFFVFFASDAPGQEEKPAQEPASQETTEEKPAQETSETETITVDDKEIDKKIPSYNYSLKQLMDKAKENIRKAEKAIKDREVLKRNKEREEKARVHFEKANALYEEGKYEEAIQEWKQALKITENKELADYIRKEEERVKKERRLREQRKQEEAQRKREEQLARERKQREKEIAKQRREKEKRERLQRQAAPLYKEAITLYKAKDYEKALEKFKEVQAILPSYGSTTRYIEREKQRLEEVKRKQEEARRRQEETRRREQEKQAEQARQEKEARKTQELRNKVVPLYKEAITLYKAKDYEKALQKFKEIQAILPGYANTTHYIEERIPQAIAREEQLEQEKKDAEKKAAAPEKKEKEAPPEKVIAVKEEKPPVPEKKEEEKVEKGELEAKAAALYSQALSLYEEKKYEQALEQFKAADALISGYGRTAYYIERIPQEIAAKQRAREVKEPPKETKEEHLVAEAKRDQLRQLNEQAAALYNDGLTLFREGDYEGALAKFEAVKEILPHYARTEYYIRLTQAKIEKDKEAATKEPDLAVQKEKKQEQARKQLEAKRAQQEERRKQEEASRKRKQEIRKQEETAQREKQEKLQKQRALEAKVLPLYREAIALYKVKEYEKSLEKFKEVQAMLPGYARTAQYIERSIPEAIAKAKEQKLERTRQEKRRILKEAEKERRLSLQEQAATLYQEARSLYKAKEYEKALEKFKEVQKVRPNYQSTEKYIVRTTRDIAQQKEREAQAKRREEEARRKEEEQLRLQRLREEERALKEKEEARRRKREEKAASLYNEALAFYKQRKYDLALSKFKELDALTANYSRTDSYLARLPKLIEKEKRIAAEKKRKEEAARLKQRISILYEEGISLFKRDELDKAQAIFEEILSLDPEQRKARECLVRHIPHRREVLNAVKSREQVKQVGKTARGPLYFVPYLYQEAITLYDLQEYEQALEKFKEVQEEFPGYRNTEYYIERIPEDMKRKRLWQKSGRQRMIERELKTFEDRLHE